MKLVLLVVVTLLGTALSQTTRNPNPCAGVVGSNLFRNDWSSCSTYFWCNNGIAEHTVPCSVGYGFDETRQLCTVAAATCAECPADQNIAVRFFLINLVSF